MHKLLVQGTIVLSPKEKGYLRHPPENEVLKTGSQLVALFWEVREMLGSRVNVEEVGD